MPQHEHSPLVRSDLRSVFERGYKPERDFGVGLEYERFGVLTDLTGGRRSAGSPTTPEDPGAPIPLSGASSIAAVFDALVAEHGWTPKAESGLVIELARGSSRITLEPGLQMELSGAVHRSLDSVAAELRGYLAEIRTVSERLGIAWLAAGTHPTASIKAIPWLPKTRYAIMREALPARGRLAHSMMKGTCGSQVNLDYSNEADAMAKLRVAMALTPVVSAAFANSPVAAGRVNGWLSERAAIWLETDPDRCGLLPFALERSASFDDYVDWALYVPMLFLVRDGRFIATQGVTFGRFVERGIEGQLATLSDWETHLSTLFPDVRLKAYIEVRGTDSNAPGLVLAHTALWKGIFYGGADVLDAAEALLAGLSVDDHRRLRAEVPKLGLAARAGGRTVLEIARDLVRIAGDALAARGEQGDESYLDPLRELLVERGICPAEDLLARLAGRPAPDPAFLIAHLSRMDLRV